MACDRAVARFGGEESVRLAITERVAEGANRSQTRPTRCGVGSGVEFARCHSRPPPDVKSVGSRMSRESRRYARDYLPLTRTTHRWAGWRIGESPAKSLASAITPMLNPVLSSATIGRTTCAGASVAEAIPDGNRPTGHLRSGRPDPRAQGWTKHMSDTWTFVPGYLSPSRPFATSSHQGTEVHRTSTDCASASMSRSRPRNCGVMTRMRWVQAP